MSCSSFQAVYSAVPVYEMLINGIGVMRRRSDSYMNCTQILKVAGIDKARRTRILEKDILSTQPYEKIQGGYGRYQGTWSVIFLFFFPTCHACALFICYRLLVSDRVPLYRARDLAQQNGVLHLLQPMIDFAPAPAPTDPIPSHSPQHPPSLPQQQQQQPVPEPQMQQQQHQQHMANAMRPTTPAKAAQQLAMSQPQQQYPMDPPSQADTQMRKRPAASDDEPNSLAQSKRFRIDTSHQTLSQNGHAQQPDSATPTSAAAASTGPRKVQGPLPPSKPGAGIGDDRAKAERHRQVLMNLFMDTSQVANLSHLNLAQILPADLDPDTPIDDQLHTALHWASALAQMTLVSTLVSFGAEPTRGNRDGETPLIRGVLATNNHDSEGFPALVEALAPSIRTTDNHGRTVLHHIALIAGVKGRKASAKYYMESVLEYIAKREAGDFAALVDAQDQNGDSALHIAARVGSKGLVNMLLEVGATQHHNKLGLLPADFGVDEGQQTPGRDGSGSPAAAAEASTAAIVPAENSKDVMHKINDMVSKLTEEFQSELTSKSTSLEETRQQLRAATRDLTERRKAVEQHKEQVQQMEARRTRISCLERALASEARFDWTGRCDAHGSPTTRDPAFAYSDQSCLTLSHMPSDGQPASAEPAGTLAGLPTSLDGLAQARRMAQWYSRAIGLLRQRIEQPKGSNVDLEKRYQRIVALCCGIQPDQVDGMLPQLLTAVESDGDDVVSRLHLSSLVEKMLMMVTQDLSRVSLLMKGAV